MVIGTYISIITLDGLNAPTKRHRLAERIQKQAGYKKPTSDLGTHTD